MLTVLRALVQAAAPDEGCALLLGGRSPGKVQASAGELWELLLVWPCLNCWPRPEERHRRFALDPREQLVAQRWARTRGMSVLGAAHSHPNGQAIPSETDCALTLAPSLMVIVGAEADAVAWWLEGEPTQPSRLPWTMGN